MKRKDVSGIRSLPPSPRNAPQTQSARVIAYVGSRSSDLLLRPLFHASFDVDQEQPTL